MRIVEDDPSVQQSLVTLFRMKGIEAIAYDSAEAFICEDIVSQPGCVLVDLNLPGMGGAELVDWINHQSQRLPAIVITGHGTVQLAASCFRSGAVDFILKPMDPELLLNRVLEVLEQDAAERARRHRLDEIRGNYEALTSRESEVLISMCAGLCSKQIAYELGISTRTVENHRAKVMSKMCTDSLALLVRMVSDLQAALGLQEYTLPRVPMAGPSLQLPQYFAQQVVSR